jgi:hypothetical protein
MRFRQKFPTVRILSAVMWIVASSAWLSKPHAIAGIRGAYSIVGFLWLVLLIIYLTSYFFTWWDITDDGLAERRLWNTRLIPWIEVRHIGLWRPVNKALAKPRANTLEIEYTRPGPMSDHGSIFLPPRERQSFLLALRTHAPQAAIEL